MTTVVTTTGARAARTGGRRGAPSVGTESASSEPTSSAPVGVAIVSSTTPYTRLASTVLARGSRGPAVRALQRALGGLAVDGAFGPRTEHAVHAFQERIGEKATGVVQETTWLALEAIEYPFLSHRATVLRTGSRGSLVRALQEALRVPVDGVFGPATEEAVRALQAEHHLASTGVVGSRTWEALDDVVRSRTRA